MRNRAFVALVAALITTIAVSPAGAAQAPIWAPVSEATIKPGQATLTGGNECTSNFVFYDQQDNVYLGQAAHCSSTADPTQTNGCIAGSMPVGTKVLIQGASKPGVLFYNSWNAMQTRKERDVNACQYNDFALIKIAKEDRDKVNPSIPVWGGPTGIAPSTNKGDKILTYTNSSLRGSIAELKPQVGISRGQSAGGWLHTVFSLLPGLPGDSGAAFIDSQGRAFGVLSTLNILPQPLTNGVGDLSRELAYANSSLFSEIQLATGTERFTGSVTPSDDLVKGLDQPLSLMESVLSLLGLLGKK